MKTSRQCPKCQSMQVGYLERLWDALADGADQAGALGRTRWGGRVFGTLQPEGELEGYVCAACGYLETYVKSPASVPFEKLIGFRWLNEPPPADGPYR